MEDKPSAGLDVCGALHRPFFYLRTDNSHPSSLEQRLFRSTLYTVFSSRRIMDIPATLAFIVILILAVAFIVRPFLAPQGDEQERAEMYYSVSALRKRADLLAARNRVYRALRDLDSEHQANKVADDDYTVRRQALVTEGVRIMAALDDLVMPDETPDTDPIEAAILAFRRSHTAFTLPKEELRCPECVAIAGDAVCDHRSDSLTSEK
ncbi:MAG: hypothetical protein JXB07_05125 [Anaerolineae bacterium]|nr:hypothetical protein [Anaerolineae bacterium]